ncbi:MAG: ATP-binding protein, partial [Bacteroidota bacterium]
YKTQKEEINFSDLTADVLQQFITRYPERNIVSEITPEIEMKGDALLLKLLISNLLENANKYSGKEKEIVLRLTSESTGAVLEITDEGVGIADAEKKNVFKKFYRIGSEQTRKTQGTGLGLYLSKKIAEDHNGTILLKDNQPNGSKFIVQFPT